MRNPLGIPGGPIPDRASRKIEDMARAISDRRENPTFPIGRQLKLPGGSDRSPATQAIDAQERRELPGKLKNYIRAGVEGRRLDTRKRRKVPYMPRMTKPEGIVKT
jgi:hypothetical protein